jgi:hypothetical protein
VRATSHMSCSLLMVGMGTAASNTCVRAASVRQRTVRHDPWEAH